MCQVRGRGQADLRGPGLAARAAGHTESVPGSLGGADLHPAPQGLPAASAADPQAAGVLQVGQV